MSSISGFNLSLKQKLAIVTTVTFTGVLFTLLLFYNGLASSVMQEKTRQSELISEAGLNQLKYFYSLIKSQDLSTEEAKKMAITALESSRFGKNGYYWINDKQGVVLMHPYVKEIIDKNQIDFQDENGNFLFKEFINTALNGGGKVEYLWPKPSIAEPFQKVSHVVYFEPWQWVLGTGLYFDDIEKDISQYSIAALGIGFGFTVILIITATSLTKKMMYQLEEMALRDSLTGLHTRRYLQENKQGMVARHDRHSDKYLSVIFLDIDYFKKINDHYGHAYGDKVIANIGKIIQQNSRPDDMCIRYGGEEFVIILLDDNEQAAYELSRRICKEAKRTVFVYKKKPFNITISAGIAHRKENESLYDTMQRADESLYQAKSRGRDKIVSA